MSKNLFEILNSKTNKELPKEIGENFLKRLPIKSQSPKWNFKILVPALFSIVFLFVIVMNNNNENLNDMQLVQNIELLEEYEFLSFLEENDLNLEDIELLLEEEIDDNLNS
jgi:hypothetical protein